MGVKKPRECRNILGVCGNRLPGYLSKMLRSIRTAADIDDIETDRRK
ncbi:MAG: hypothetical protein ACPGJO_10340 [bacterium]